MVDTSVYPKLSSYSALSNADVVLDAGAGFGFLTRFLANRCKEVIAVERDRAVAQALREEVANLANVTVVEDDVLKADISKFNKTVSIPPYYLSSELVTWLLDRCIEIAVLIVQQEFADRLVAPVGSDQYGWLTVVTQHAAEAKLLDVVPRWMFFPEPEVDSVIVWLKPWIRPSFDVKDKAFFRKLVKWLFSQRNKKLENAAAPFIRSELKLDKAKAADLAATLPLQCKRVRELTPADFGEIADALLE